MKGWYLIVLSVSLIGVLVSCNDKSKGIAPIEPPVENVDEPQIENMTFKRGDNIKLTISEYHHGGVIDFEYDLPEGVIIDIFNDGDNKGRLVFRTEPFDLSNVSGNNIGGIVPRPSYFGFGEELVFPMKFIASKDGDKFKGEKSVYDARGVEISVSADISKDKTLVDFYIRDAKVFNDYHNEISIWGGMDDFNDPMTGLVLNIPERNGSYKYINSPFFIEWSSETYPEDIKSEIAPEDFLQILLNTPFLLEEEYGFCRGLNAQISIGDLIGRIGSVIEFPMNTVFLQSMKFAIAPLCKDLSSDKIVDLQYPYFPYYVSSSYSGGSPFGICDLTESSFSVSVDPLALFNIRISKSLSPKSDSSDPYLWAEMSYYDSATRAMNAFLSNVILALSPENANGIPMNYTILTHDEGASDLSHFVATFVRQDMSLKLLDGIILPLLRDDGNKERLIEALSADEYASPYLKTLTMLIDQLDTLFAETTDIKFGFSYSWGTTAQSQDALVEMKYNSLYGH